MPIQKDAKAMAKSLRAALAERNVALSHGECLEIVARQLGFADWNTLSARVATEEARVPRSHPDTASPQAVTERAPEPATERVPVIPLRDVVVYPEIVMPIFLGRPKSVHAAEVALRGDKRVLLVTQRQPDINDPASGDLYQTGTVAHVLDVSHMPNGSAKVLVKGMDRARLRALHTDDPPSASITVSNDVRPDGDMDVDALRKGMLARFERYAKRSGMEAKLTEAGVTLATCLPPSAACTPAHSRTRWLRRLHCSSLRSSRCWKYSTSASASSTSMPAWRAQCSAEPAVPPGIGGFRVTLYGLPQKKETAAMNRHLLSRRQFGARCAAFGLSFPAMGTLVGSAAALAAPGAPSQTAARTVRFPDGTTVPAVGQGAWHLGQGRHPTAVEEEALHTGISLGMSLIDTSGNYGDGRSEQFIGHAIAGQRERVYLVSKVEADEVSGDGIARACQASLARLGTDHLDLYLLHSPVPGRQFAGVVAAFEKLRAAGKIHAWGVSNFDRGQMEDLFRVPDGQRCATNQVPYSLNNRRIERDLLPWCMQHNMPVMAYSPLGGDHNLVVGNRTLAQIGSAHGCSAAAIALAWVIRDGNVIAIPESGSPAHTRENAAALATALTPQDIQTLAKTFS